MYDNTQEIDKIAVLDTIYAGTDATVLTAYISMDDKSQICFCIDVVTAGTSVNAKLVQATASAGTGKKDVTGKAITEIAVDGEKAKINITDIELDYDNGFNFVALEVTTVDASVVQAVAVTTSTDVKPYDDGTDEYVGGLNTYPA